MAIIKTAILQTHVYTDKFRNITQAAELLASPELQGIDLAVLPEMFCCPYENKYFPEYAEPEGGETWEKCYSPGCGSWHLSCVRQYAGA